MLIILSQNAVQARTFRRRTLLHTVSTNTRIFGCLSHVPSSTSLNWANLAPPAPAPPGRCLAAMLRRCPFAVLGSWWKFRASSPWSSIVEFDLIAAAVAADVVEEEVGVDDSL